MLTIIDLILNILVIMIQLFIFTIILFSLSKLFKIEKKKFRSAFFISFIVFIPAYLLSLSHPFLGSLLFLLYALIVGILSIKKMYNVDWKITLLIWFLWFFIAHILFYLYSLFIFYLKPF